MRDDAALLDAIRAMPFDDLSRLIYADWLEEYGQLPRAEFIRVQVELARTTDDAGRREELRRRELDLIIAHKEQWFGACRRQWRYYEVRRGFLHEIWSPAVAVLPYLNWLHEEHALAQLRLSATLDEVEAVLAHPLVAGLRS